MRNTRLDSSESSWVGQAGDKVVRLTKSGALTSTAASRSRRTTASWPPPQAACNAVISSTSAHCGMQWEHGWKGPNRFNVHDFPPWPGTHPSNPRRATKLVGHELNHVGVGRLDKRVDQVARIVRGRRGCRRALRLVEIVHDSGNRRGWKLAPVLCRQQHFYRAGKCSFVREQLKLLFPIFYLLFHYYSRVGISVAECGVFLATTGLAVIIASKYKYFVVRNSSLLFSSALTLLL